MTQPKAVRITGSWVRRWRESLGLTQADASALLGLAHRNSIGRIERGERFLSVAQYLACLYLRRTDMALLQGRIGVGLAGLVVDRRGDQL